MSKKYCGLQVTFEKEINEDYLDILKNMIMSLKGVISVQEVESDYDYHFAKNRAKHELRMQILEVLKSND